MCISCCWEKDFCNQGVLTTTTTHQPTTTTTTHDGGSQSSTTTQHDGLTTTTELARTPTAHVILHDDPTPDNFMVFGGLLVIDSELMT